MAKSLSQIKDEWSIIKNETIEDANTATRVGGAGVDIVEYIVDLEQNTSTPVKRYKDEVATEAILKALPVELNEIGDGRVVTEDVDANGQSYTWVWDGESWSRTPYTTLPADVVSESVFNSYNLNEKISSELRRLGALPPTSLTGEALNGASISSDGRTITIPSGYKGTNSYVMSVFSNSKALNVLKEAYAKNTGSVYGILKYSVTDSSLFPYITPRIQKNSSTSSIGVIVGSVTDGNIRYILYRINSDLADLSIRLRIGFQITTTANVINECSITLEDATFFISNPESYSRSLSNISSDLKAITISTYGTRLIANSRFATFVGGIACNNTPCITEGYLNNIYIRISGGGGIIRFGLGILDQRNWAIIRTTFTADVTSNIQTLNLSDRNILVKSGEILFVYLDDANNAPMFGFASSQADNLMMYNDADANAALKPLATTNGGYLTLSWTISEIHSDSFATKIDVEVINDDINNINEEIVSLISNKNIVPDYLGNKYELRVVEGNLVAIPMIYSDAVCLGNSITDHIITDYWRSRCGMAASRPENDYVHVLERGLRTKVSTATVAGFSLYSWERDFNVDKEALLGNILTSDRDLIVFRLGENVPIANIPSFEAAFDDLVLYVISKCPRAKIVITGVFWTKAEKDTALMNVANKYGFPFVRLSDLDVSENKAKAGDLVWGDDGLQYEILAGSGVDGHPNDSGHSKIGNRLRVIINYPTE